MNRIDGARIGKLLALATAAAALAACAGGGRKEEELARDVGLPDYSINAKAGVETGVNKYLWSAALATVDFMPISYADPYAGLIISDWHSAADAPNERLKTNIYILDKRLRTDAIKVAVFRQQLTANGWIDVGVQPGTAREVENAILTRARELRLNTTE